MTTKRAPEAATVGLGSGLRAWLASGSAQSPSGAFYAWISEGTREPSFEYPEITGYALTHLAAQEDPVEEEVDAGRSAVRWLLSRLAGGDRSAHFQYDQGAVYNFDLAMIATGLMSFGTRFSLGDATELGLALAGDLAAEVHQKGRLDSVPASSPRRSSRSAWSTRGDAHLLKAVQSLLWSDHLQVAGSLEAAHRLVRYCTKSQEDDGRFVTHPDDHETMLHPHLYAMEGLWMYASATGDAEARERARQGTEWVFQQRLESGGFPRFVPTEGGPVGPEQMDATAQALRTAALTDFTMERMKPTLDRLGDVVVAGSDGSVLPYQPLAEQRDLNVWATLFAAQAVDLVESPTAPLLWRYLV